MRARTAVLTFTLLLAVGATAGSRISITKMGGDILVEDAPHGATLRTMGGDIVVRHAGGDVVAKTMGGEIDIATGAGDVEAGSMGGDIHLHVTGAGAGRSISLHTMGGKVDVVVPRNFDAAFTVEIHDANHEGSHRVISDVPLVESRESRWSFFGGRKETLVARSRSGGSSRVEISTWSSDVTIRRE